MNWRSAHRLVLILMLIANILAIYVQGQTISKKSLQAVRVDVPPRIDGDLDDEAWQKAFAAKDFTQIQPYNGKPASLPTEVKIVYDNYALYVGAMMFDRYPDSISTELSKRDDINMSDFFGIYLDPFNDYLTAYGFMVTAAGVQIDLKSTESNGEDISWNAVWKSHVSLTDSGWIAEMEIPYSALRFPTSEPEKVWGLQLFRQIIRFREKSSWNYIDRNAKGLNNQAGLITGISNIKPPVRLSVVPYLSAYIEKNPDKSRWTTLQNFGMDLKYGLNESFTLDVTLVPDFGQVASDDIVYNLTPFEVYYVEKRPFFMEGTELFRRGNVLYSRRIGALSQEFTPVGDSLKMHEVIRSKPQTAQLINASKLSGKTGKGLGIGVFNAMSANTFTEVRDTITSEKREILTGPFANYNMFVVDQSLKNNSFFSIFNTNVWKPETNYSANVSGTEFRFTGKRNLWSALGRGTISQRYRKDHSPGFGHAYYIRAGKVSGRFLYEMSHEVATDTYDQNDLGYLQRNNKLENLLILAYNMYEPRGNILEWTNKLTFSYDFLYNPRKFTSFNLNYSLRTTSEKHLTVWLNTLLSPVNAYDYFEPRTPGYYYTIPPFYSVNAGLSPDYRKKFLVDIRGGFQYSDTYRQTNYLGYLGPRFRANDRLMIILGFEYSNKKNNIGFVGNVTEENNKTAIIFGKRNISVFTNTLTADYKFTNKSSLSLRTRHYLFTGVYNTFYTLLGNGGLHPATYEMGNDFTYNAFNIDMSYLWNFAPGSEIVVVWKNSVFAFKEANSLIMESDDELKRDYFYNLSHTIGSPAANSFSIKVLYYIDYQYLKKLRRSH